MGGGSDLVVEAASGETVQCCLALRVFNTGQDLLPAVGQHAAQALQVTHVDLRGWHGRDEVVDGEQEHESQVV